MSRVTVFFQPTRQEGTAGNHALPEHFNGVEVAENRITDLCRLRREIRLVDGAVEQGSGRHEGFKFPIYVHLRATQWSAEKD